MFISGRPITDEFIKELVKAGAKPLTSAGKLSKGKLTFPTAAPTPWARLRAANIHVIEKGDELVAVVR